MSTLIRQALQGGKYILDKELQQDDFGVTYQATHHHLGQIVLIKTLNEASQQAPNFAEHRCAFQNEVRQLAVCVHPNIVRIHDCFIEDGLPYIVMDYIPGQTLQKIVFPDRPLPEAIAIRYIQQIGEALQVMHQNCLLHRDITPNHIVIHPKTQAAVLIDFGLAREFASDSTQTQTLLLSSNGYTAIEQYLAQDRLTPATDVYRLAATLYALLTAKSPVTSILREHQPLPPPRYLRPELSPEVNQAVLSGMALERYDRPNTMAEWLSLLPGVETTNSSTPSQGASRSLDSASPQVAASRHRVRYRPKGNQATPQLMTGIVPTTGFDRRWLTFGAMVFGGILTLFATIALLLKFYSPKPMAPLPAVNPNGEGGGIPLWDEVGIPTLKQQPPTVPDTSVPDISVNVPEDPLSQPLQPLSDQAPIPELLFEELESLSEDLNPDSSAALPAKTGPKNIDQWEEPSSPTTALPLAPSQSFEDSAPPASDDLTLHAPPSIEEAPTSDPASTLLPETTPAQEILPETPENPDVLPETPENPDVLPENPENPEVLPKNFENPPASPHPAPGNTL